MNIKTMEITQEDVLLVNKLTRLLEEQINIIHSSDVSGKKVEILAVQIQSIVNEIASKGLLDLDQFREQREHIKRLYDNLNIAIIARKNETEKSLNQIRKGKKVVEIYRR